MSREGLTYLLRTIHDFARACHAHEEVREEDIANLTKDKQVSLVRIQFPHPESDGKSSDVGVEGQNGILIRFERMTDKHSCKK